MIEYLKLLPTYTHSDIAHRIWNLEVHYPKHDDILRYDEIIYGIHHVINEKCNELNKQWKTNIEQLIDCSMYRTSKNHFLLLYADNKLQCPIVLLHMTTTNPAQFSLSINNQELALDYFHLPTFTEKCKLLGQQSREILRPTDLLSVNTVLSKNGYYGDNDNFENDDIEIGR